MPRPSSIKRRSRKRRAVFLSAVYLLLAAGCATAHQEQTGTPVASHEEEQTLSLSERLHAEVAKWDGTPHRLGGTTRKGVDCSGFVQRLYQDLLGLQLPRTTTLQVLSGRPVEKSRLIPGDLVFFKPPYKQNHVGIYLGDSRFAHASTSQGVTVSNLSDTYWRQSYWTARRYVDRPTP